MCLDYCIGIVIEIVVLFDGSCVVFDVDLVIVVYFDGSICMIDLLCGWVWFEVVLDL